jgi:membrane protein
VPAANRKGEGSAMASGPLFVPSLAKLLWQADVTRMPHWKRILFQAGRIAYDVTRDVVDGSLTLHATSLVYTTLLSLVPLLAFSFSVLKSFGVHNAITPLLLNVLEPLGGRAEEVTRRIIEFVENMRVGVLGALGLALLVWTVVSLMQKIEASFNETWRISNQRTMARRFSDFLSVILIGPLLMFSAFGISASLSANVVVERLRDYEVVGWAIELTRTITPYLLIVGAFTFLYVFIPNTKVRFVSAFIGATVAGLLWVAAGWIFGSFVASSASYTAIYSAFATPILFMIWLYVSWLILLVGASISFYHQHPESVKPTRAPIALSGRLKERTALQIMSMIGRDYYSGANHWTLKSLAKALNLACETVDPVLGALEQSGLLTRTADLPPRYLPGRPLDETPLSVVIQAVRQADEQRTFGHVVIQPDPAIEALGERIDRALDAVLKRQTVKHLALGEDVDDGEAQSEERTNVGEPVSQDARACHVATAAQPEPARGSSC